MSMTNTSVVVPETPSWGSPEVPKPCAGGITVRTRLPIFLPTSADSRPGSSLLGITAGLLVKVLCLRAEVVPSQKYKTKLAAMASLLVRVAPVPWTSVLTVRLLPALAFGIVTVGTWPNAPVAVTEALAPAEDEDDAEAVDFDDDPQP